MFYFCPNPGTSRSWSQPGSAHMGTLLSYLHPPSRNFSKKRPVNTSPKDALRPAGGCKSQQMSAVCPAGPAACQVGLSVIQHGLCMMPLEELGPLHEHSCARESFSLTGGAHGQYFVPKAVLQPASP